MKKSLSLIPAMIILAMSGVLSLGADEKVQRHNILFIISDDLTYTALSCYGNTVCTTPKIAKSTASFFNTPFRKNSATAIKEEIPI